MTPNPTIKPTVKRLRSSPAAYVKTSGFINPPALQAAHAPKKLYCMKVKTMKAKILSNNLMKGLIYLLC